MKLFKTAAIVVLLLAAGAAPGRAHDSAAIEREIRAKEKQVRGQIRARTEVDQARITGQLVIPD